MSQLKAVQRKDYRPYPYKIDRVDLHFDLHPEQTRVRTTLEIRQINKGSEDLFLDGEDLNLETLLVNGVQLASEDYHVGEAGLTIHNFSGGTVETLVTINPAANTQLSGLYQSGGLLCTQCEAEGFRRITYYPDRPDVMSVFTTTLEADSTAYPLLLSNGNKVKTEDLAGHRQRVTWHDPHPKPAYLFAVVAGDLICTAGNFTTQEGREVRLEILVEPRNKHLCQHALESLAESMRWDEQRYGRCYDLDIYMIVAVDDFNMGAMENKGLNIFNAKYVLASPETATDADYEHVAAVIAHEYFHNWTGNRITCRDWFQLTLKEGLTVFRDQQFTADHTSAAVKRIDDVRLLRSHQFPEDAGPQRHPIRPEQYVVMDNFYTVTVYEKGAEVIRMYETLLTPAGFRRGMDLYFNRHDGQAVTCDDFRAAMADANKDIVDQFDPNLKQFEHWYSQSGTPTVKVQTNWNSASQQLTLTITQSGPEQGTPARPKPYQPTVIPFHFAGFHADGLPYELTVNDTCAHEQRLILTKDVTEIVINDVEQLPVLSLLRGFSAPVHLDAPTSDDDLAILAAHDTDPFNRWQAGQELAQRTLAGAIADPHNKAQPSAFSALAAAWKTVLTAKNLDPALQARALQLPSLTEILQTQKVMDFDSTGSAVRHVRNALREELREQLLHVYQNMRQAAGTLSTQQAIGQRALAMTCLSILGADGALEGIELATAQFDEQRNMTEVQAALQVLVYDAAAAADPLTKFYDQWQHDPLVIDKWFAVQAGIDAPDCVERVTELTKHQAFSLATPNRARSVLGVFAGGNLLHFNRADGKGYELLAHNLKQLCTQNPQLAARLTGAFNQWRRCDAERAAQQRGHLQAIKAVPGCARDVIEVIDRALADAG